MQRRNCSLQQHCFFFFVAVVVVANITLGKAVSMCMCSLCVGVSTCDCWISLSRERGCACAMSREASSPRLWALCWSEQFMVRSSNTSPCSCSTCTQPHTKVKGFTSHGNSSSRQAGWRQSLTSACFSFSVVCSSDALSLSLSLSMRSLKPSSSDTLSCASMWDSRSNKTLFCTEEEMMQTEKEQSMELFKEAEIDD